LTENPNLDTLLSDLAVDVVAGHLGDLRPDLSTGDLPYSSVAEFARRLVREAPERVLWGSDWPHDF